MFEALIERLALGLRNAKITFMIMGGQAVLLYGEPRLTRDIDITLGIDPSRADELLRLVELLKLKILVDDPKDFLTNTFVLPVIEESSGIRVDFVFSLSDYERFAISRSKLVRIGATDVNYISLEDLIIAKIIAARPRDLEDVKSVLIKNPEADLGEVRKWLMEFDAALGTDCIKTIESLLVQIQK